MIASLVTLGCKVVIIHGTKDTVVPPSVPDNVVKAVEQRTAINDGSATNNTINLVMMEGFGHFPHEEDPTAFLEVLQKHVKINHSTI